MIDPLRILWTQLQTMAADFVRLLPQLLIAMLVLVLTWLAARFARRIADRLLAKAEMRGSLINLAETLISVLMWVFGILVAMTIIFPGVTPESLLAVLGFTSIAVGFAFKDIFENFLAGVLIMVRKKMNIGDEIQCGDYFGRVEHITLRDSHIRIPSGELVLMPNSYLFQNPVTVMTEARTRRYQIEVGIGYDVDLDAASGVIATAIRSIPGVDQNRVDVFATAFGDSSINLLVRWWADGKSGTYNRTRDAAVRVVKKALDEAGMEIPYPYRTLTFKEPLALKRAATPQSRSAPDRN